MNNQGESFVLVDKTIEAGGHQIRLHADLTDVMSIMQAYQDALLDARGVPLRPEAFDQNTDPYVSWVIQNRRDIYIDPATGKDFPDAGRRIQSAVVRYYERLHSEANTEAAMLALVSKNPDPGVEPKPYEEEQTLSLPGLIEEPKVRKNLNIPVERRLKQFMDLFEGDREAFLEVSQTFQTVSVEIRMRLEGRTAEGFRDEPAGGSGNKKTGTKSKE